MSFILIHTPLMVFPDLWNFLGIFGIAVVYTSSQVGLQSARVPSRFMLLSFFLLDSLETG